jgi:hypothetical protein
MESILFILLDLIYLDLQYMINTRCFEPYWGWTIWTIAESGTTCGNPWRGGSAMLNFAHQMQAG